MSAPGVGVLVSLTYASAIDDPECFRRSKQVGAHFGMTPKRYQFGEKDVSGPISKIGDRSVRTVFARSRNIILTKPVKAGALESRTLRLAAHAGMKKAKAVLACKLAAASHAPTGDAACTERWSTARRSLPTKLRWSEIERRGVVEFGRTTTPSAWREPRRRDDGSDQAVKCKGASEMTTRS